MKHWGVLATLVYALLCIGLAGPIMSLLFEMDSMYSPEFYGDGWVWFWIATLVAGQLLLFGVRVEPSTMRWKPQRHVLIPIAGAGIFASLLICMALWAIWVVVLDTDPWCFNNATDEWAIDSYGAFLFWIGIGWVAWTAIVAWSVRGGDPAEIRSRLLFRLLQGSVLELIIAVPCHVLIRKRDYCCAPPYAGLGIMTAIAVMLLLIGPGCVLLYGERIARKRPR